MKIRVCFVCLGNICRSPTAEAMFRAHVDRAGLAASFEIDSAGTAAYHAGSPPDRRSAGAAAQRGITLEGRARAFLPADFDRFDFVLAMDRQNLTELQRLRATRPGETTPSLLRRYDPLATGDDDEVPDPYYGGDKGFETVLDICDRAAAGLLATVRSAQGL